MEFFHIFSGILVLSAIFAFINHKFFHLPGISLMIASLGISLITILLGSFFPEPFHAIQENIASIDFSEIVLEFMLSFLLFAGALHTAITDWPRLNGPF